MPAASSPGTRAPRAPSNFSPSATSSSSRAPSPARPTCGDGTFVNIDGFNCGEKTEIFWAMRAYELALEEGVRLFVYGNLDYGYKKGGYDARFRCGHYDAKGRAGEWILLQNQCNRGRMGAALLTTGPYVDMAISDGTPMAPTVEEDGALAWKVPLGAGAVPHVCLEDCGHYARWLFDNPDRASGPDLEVAIEHVYYAAMVRAFEAVTGRPARYVDVGLETYWRSDPLSPIARRGCGYNSDPSDPAFMTIEQNFTGFWNLWKNSGGNEGVVRRDYKLLDDIHPDRVKSVEDWFRRVDGRERARGSSLWERVQAGNRKSVLKIHEDGSKGVL